MAIFKDIINIKSLIQINAFYYDMGDKEHFLASITVPAHGNSVEDIIVISYLLKGRIYQLDAPIIGRMESRQQGPLNIYSGEGLTGGETLGSCDDLKEGAQIILAS